MCCRLITCIIFYVSVSSICVLSNALDEKSKDIKISSEELLHRRKILDSYLLLSAENQKDWIETYSVHFDSKVSTGSSETVLPKSPDLQNNVNSFDERKNDISGSAIPETLKESERTFTEFPEVVEDIQAKKTIVSSFSSSYQDSRGLQDMLDSGEAFTNKNDLDKPETFSNPAAQNLNGNAILQSAITKKIPENNSGQVDGEGSSDDSLKMHDPGDESNIETTDHSAEKNINHIKDFEEVLSEIDSLQNNDIDENSNGTAKEVLLETDFMQINNVGENSDGSRKEVLSETDSTQVNNIKENFNDSSIKTANEIKTKEIHIAKEFLPEPFFGNANKINMGEINTKEDNNSPNLKRVLLTNNVIDSDDSNELQQRKKILNSYLSKYGAESKDWVETYNFILKADGLTDPSNTERLSVSPHQQNDLKWMFKDTVSQLSPILDCAREQKYIIRWLKKLTDKIEKYEHKSICLSFNSETLNTLNGLSSSKCFDIINIDEFFSSLISNATIHSGFKLIDYAPSFQFLSYAVCIASIVFVIYFLWQKPFFLFLFFIILLIFFSVFMHGYKMYQSKIAEKHHTVSNIFPPNCVNTLTKNSGTFDHVWEYFREKYYHEECKKYYESVMVDAVFEINFFVVLADLISTIFLQFFKVLAHTLNYSVKAALYRTTWTEIIIILIIFMFFLLICFNYTIKIPFVSFEPSFRPVGSHAEDLRLPKRKFLEYFFPKNNYGPALKVEPVDKKNSKTADTKKENCNDTDLYVASENPQQKQIYSISCNETKSQPIDLPNLNKKICSVEDVKTKVISLSKELTEISDFSSKSPISSPMKVNSDPEIYLDKHISKLCNHLGFEQCLIESLKNTQKRLELLRLESIDINSEYQELLNRLIKIHTNKFSSAGKVSESSSDAFSVLCTDHEVLIRKLSLLQWETDNLEKLLEHLISMAKLGTGRINSVETDFILCTE